MIIEEIELPIKGTISEIENKLLSNNFEVFYKVLTISSYYLPTGETTENHSTLKSRCKRIRYVEPIAKFKNEWQNYKNWIKEYNLEECKKEEQMLLDMNYKKIYTDEKIDCVYKKIDEEKMFFQIQNIKDHCLIIAYDNEKYYDIEKGKQRELLIEDVKKYGIDILSTINVDRFKLVGKTLSIKDIIDKMNAVIYKLEKED